MYWLPSTPGEIADRWTILKLKLRHVNDEAARQSITAEMRSMRMPAYDDYTLALVEALGKINERVWELQTTVRSLMHDDKNPEFVETARKLPILNDTRAHLKARIDQHMGFDPAAVPKQYALRFEV